MSVLKILLLSALQNVPVWSLALSPRDDSLSYLGERGAPLAKANEASIAKNEIMYSAMWTEENTNGFINLGTAENYLTHEDIKQHIEKDFSIDVYQEMTYNSSVGSPRLRSALASFMNDEFHPFQPVKAEEFSISSGLSAMFDEVAWALCDGPQDGIMVPVPLYNSFSKDFSKRSNATLVPASFIESGHEYDMNEVFDASANYKALQRGWDEATKNGIKIKAVFVVNPHNPLGRCYSKDALTQFVRFCNEKKIHLFSDEIYAKSVYKNDRYPHATPFTSLLSLDLDKMIDSQLVHAFYGMSKDYAASGLRIGTLWSRNKDLLNAVSSLNGLSHPSFTQQTMWAGILEDKSYLKSYWTRYSKQLGESFNSMRDWFEKRNITYFEGTNSGLFLWARLVNWPQNRTDEDYEAWKTKFMNDVLDAKLNIADGETYKPENTEKGWFRLVHSVGAARQKAGLERLDKVLAQNSI